MVSDSMRKRQQFIDEVALLVIRRESLPEFKQLSDGELRAVLEGSMLWQCIQLRLEATFAFYKVSRVIAAAVNAAAAWAKVAHLALGKCSARNN